MWPFKKKPVKESVAAAAPKIEEGAVEESKTVPAAATTGLQPVASQESKASKGSKAKKRKHVRRSTVNGESLITDACEPSGLESCANTAPPFLRGTLLDQYNLKREAFMGARQLIEDRDGIAAKYGFQRGETGSARCAVEGLVADITGGGGVVTGLEDAGEYCFRCLRKCKWL